MLQARVPPGRHVVVVRYWPSTFTAGIVLAIGAVATFVVVFLLGWVRRHRRRRPEDLVAVGTTDPS
jgi:hypothetical protein